MPYSVKRTVKQQIRERVTNKTLIKLVSTNIPIDQAISNQFKTCNATTRVGHRCKMKAVNNTSKCVIHGGKSTGPKTKEGRRKALANLVQYRDKKAKIPD